MVQLFVLPSLPPPPAPGLRQLTHLLRHADARLGLLTVALMIAGHFAAYTYVTPFLKENPAITPAFLSTLLLAYGVAGIVGNFAGGVLAARYLRPTLGGVIVLLAGSILLLPIMRGRRTRRHDAAHHLGACLRRAADRAPALGLQGRARGARGGAALLVFHVSDLHRAGFGARRTDCRRFRHLPP
ncbi:MAG: hypothetical protein WDM96_18505 [Lacunisphaera sp.]